MITAVVLVAGGTGTRMGSDRPKQFLDLCGKPVFIRTLEIFLAWRNNLFFQVVMPEAYLAEAQELVEKHSNISRNQIGFCSGGETRTLSVWKGLQALASIMNPEDMVCIHDAVRPLIQSELLTENENIGNKYGNAIACIPVKSSLRRITPLGTEAVDRSQFYHVQTPQSFVWKSIWNAYSNRTSDDFTDDASLLESQGENIYISSGNYDNLKLTTPEDLLLARLLFENLPKP
jgi:2-C-methyl-D-erythritol 4-phosphate cytidylyltransferase